MRVGRTVRIGLWRRLAAQILSQQDRRQCQSRAPEGRRRSPGRDAGADARGVSVRRSDGSAGAEKTPPPTLDGGDRTRQSGVEGKRGSAGVILGGDGKIKKKK